MSEFRELIAEECGQRLDRFVAVKQDDLSRSHVSHLVSIGMITVGGFKVKPSYKLKRGELIEIEIPIPPPTTIVQENIPITIIHEDEDILVIDKPAGMVVHPAPGHPTGTVVNALVSRMPNIDDFVQDMRPGIVHRLDKDTSGLMVVAKNRIAHQHVAKQIKDRIVRKTYLALVNGRLEGSDGHIRANVGRDPKNRKRMAIVESGRDAETSYKVVERFESCTLLKVSPKTGRTHQIRVHLSSLGHPVIGDSVYGVKDITLNRHFLHAHVLGFTVPQIGIYREFVSDLPDELATFLANLRLDHHNKMAINKSD